MVASVDVGHRVYVSKVIAFLLLHDCILSATYDEGSDTIRVGGDYYQYDDTHPDGGYDACSIEYIPPTIGAARDLLQY